jgi:hypothetical protein
MNFTTWKELKKVQIRDLAFLNLFKTDEERYCFNTLAEKMAALSPSFSDGLSFLETASELILMGHREDLFNNSSLFSEWNRHLRQLRYPATSAREQQSKIKIESMKWPAGAKLKFERRGDRFGVEMKYFISTSADILKLKSALERLYDEMKQNEIN